MHVRSSVGEIMAQLILDSELKFNGAREFQIRIIFGERLIEHFHWPWLDTEQWIYWTSRAHDKFHNGKLRTAMD